MAQTITKTVQQGGRLSTLPNSVGFDKTMKTKLKIDPVRALEPARKKLSTLEAQRVMSVLNDTIKRAELVTILPQIMDNLDKYSVSFGTELVAVLHKHQIIASSFEEVKRDTNLLLEREANLRDEIERRRRNQTVDMEQFDVADETDSIDDSPEALELQRVIHRVQGAVKSLTAVARQMQHSTKNVIRAFMMNPHALQFVFKEVFQRPVNTKKFIQCLYDLRDILMVKLLTTPIEDAEKTQYMQEITEREQQNAKTLEKLDADFASAQKEKTKQIEVKNDVIKKLQADLHSIERYSEEYVRRTKQEQEKQQTSDMKNNDGKIARLQAEYQQLNSQLQNKIQEHRDSEKELRKQKFRIETEVENWIQKYDQDMGVRQDEYEEIDAIYTEEKKQLHELEERFKTLKEEYDQIQEERRIAREKREESQRMLAAAIRGATVIQAFWRSYKVRKALRSKKKKEKKGKKKGKGKKGKKSA